MILSLLMTGTTSSGAGMTELHSNSQADVSLKIDMINRNKGNWRLQIGFVGSSDCHQSISP